MGKKRLLAWLLCLAMAISLLSGFAITAQAAGPSPGTRVEPTVTYATDSGAFLKNLKFSQSAAWNLTVEADPTASGLTYAVLLRYDLFNSNYNSDGSIGGINPGTYTALKPGTDNSNYYRYQNENATAGTQLTIFNKTLFNFNSGNTGYQLGESSTTYHMRYALIVFDGGTTVKDLSDYTIVSFYINSEGWLQTESYMLRYQQNKYPVGTNAVGSMPDYQIEGWGTDATVNDSKRPTRTGYNFLGWDPNATLMDPDANKAAVQAVTPKYPAGQPGSVPWEDVKNAFGTETFNSDKDQIYDLYAVWRPIPVKFKQPTPDSTLEVDGVTLHVLTLPSPQVGVQYTQDVDLDVVANQKTATNTTKTYNYTQLLGKDVYEVKEVDGTPQRIKVGTTENIFSSYKLSTAQKTNISFTVSGKPEEHSDGEPVFVVLQVKDAANNTTDLILLKFPEVRKGAQPIPTLDDNTGLDTQIVPGANEGDPDDGQIIGFYSKGPTIQTEGNLTGYLPINTNPALGTYGTGSMAGYYTTNRMIYEYRPIKVAGEYLDPESAYVGMPNDGWREVPLTRNYYGDKYITGTTRQAFEQSLMKNATALITTEYAPNNNQYAPVRVLTAPTGWAGWPDSYGWIEYADDSANAVPVIHGLNADDVYEVRFRANSSYSESAVQTLTIGGMAGGATTGGASGMGVSLSGGSVTAEDGQNLIDFVVACAQMKPGDTIEIPEWEPVRENYSFAGWTLGQLDDDGNLILYKYGAGATTPTEPEEPSPTPTETGSPAPTPTGTTEPAPTDSPAVIDETEPPAATESPTPSESPEPTESPEPSESPGGDTPAEPVTVTLPATDEAHPIWTLAAVWNSTTEGVLAVTAFDWDGTMLGSFVFRADTNPATQQANAEAALEGFIAQEAVAAKLESHAGYDFLAWVKNDSNVPTSYGKRVDTNTNTDVVNLSLSPEHIADFSTLVTSTTIKAAYTTNDSIQLGEGLSVAEARDARYYKTSIDSYGRFGIGQSFAIRIKVERGNVPRATQGYLRVRMVISGADIYSQYPLSGADEEIIEIAPYARSATSGTLTGASIVEWTVIDAYGTENWVGAGSRTTLADCQSKASFTVRDVGTSRNQMVWDRGTYPFEGVIAGINDTLASYHALKLADPSISPGNSNMAGITAPILRTIGVPVGALATARGALYEKYVANGAQPLDYASIYEAVSGQPLE